VAFVLFDMDEDGKLTFEEVTMYISSVLRVVRVLSHDVTGDWTAGKGSIESTCVGSLSFGREPYPFVLTICFACYELARVWVVPRRVPLACKPASE